MTIYCDNHFYLAPGYKALQEKWGPFVKGLFTDVYGDGDEWLVLIKYADSWVVGFASALRHFDVSIVTEDAEEAYRKYKKLLNKRMQ